MSDDVGAAGPALSVANREDHPGCTDSAARKRLAAFECAEASLALDGLRPSGPLYERLRADVIAGRVSFEQAAFETSASFGRNIE